MNTHRLKPHQVYWGLIETRGLPPVPLAPLRPLAVRRRLVHLLDPLLPVPVEEVHPVFVPLDESRVACAAVDRAAVAALRAFDRVIPDSAHATLPLDTSRFNFLVGEFRPLSTARAGARRAVAASVSLLLIALLVAVGNLRRAAACDLATANLREQQAALYDTALGPARVSALPPAALLTTELRRLQATRHTDSVPIQPDAAVELQAVLATWPQDAEIRVERLAVSANRIDLAAEAADPATAEHLIASCRALSSWTIDQNRIDRPGQTGEAVRLRLGLKPSGAGP